MRRSVLFAAVLAVVMGCEDEGGNGGGKQSTIDADTACDMASDHLRSEPRPFPDGNVYKSFKIVRCAEFKSVLSEGAASIEVLASKTIPGDPNDARPGDTEVADWFLCVMGDYDQGWIVDACVPAP